MALSQTRELPPADLTNCDREPIHIPSRIQPNGALLVAGRDRRLLQVSSNTFEQLGMPVESLLESSLDALLDPADLEQIDALLAETSAPGAPLYLPATTIGANETRWDAVVHATGELVVVELLPASHEGFDTGQRQYQLVRNALTQLRAARTVEALCQAAAEQIRRMTGFDRVMIYQFDRDWNGAVVAEAKDDSLEPWLGLHYPSTDIPKQARELYRRNWIRFIADVDYQPIPIVPEENPLSGDPLDMSHCVLRSVSPVHLQYLRNMEVGASMSVSILNGDELWGLIACHHRTPRFVPYEMRLACELLGQVFSTQIPATEELEQRSYRARIRQVHESLLDQMTREPTFYDGLTQGLPSLLDYIECDGAALYREEAYSLLGTGPSELEARELVEWLNRQAGEPVFITDSLPANFPPAEQYKHLACGIIALRISQKPNVYVFWFRPEVIQTVNWAGDPDRPAEAGPGGELCPRRSFELWKQTVQGTSRPWRRWETDAVADLRTAIISEELGRLNAELKRSNDELDAFAYIASHDLKEPLRGIQAYAEFLIEDYADRLDEDGVYKLRALSRLSNRLSDQINSLLHYSRVGRVELARRPTDLNELVTSVVDTLRMSPLWQNMDLRVPRPLPTIVCDRVRMSEVFYNLLSNAAKYNDRQDRWVEVGTCSASDVSCPVEEPPDKAVYYVRDNGIGIREKHWDSVFHFFKRLHGREKYGGGTGAGLAIVKTVIERHGGRIWVDSTYGEGTTFYFTLSTDERSP